MNACFLLQGANLTAVAMAALLKGLARRITPDAIAAETEPRTLDEGINDACCKIESQSIKPKGKSATRLAAAVNAGETYLPLVQH